MRDVAARISSYLPYTYVKQKAWIAASLRLIGCELETIEVDLWRDGKWVQKRRLEVGDSSVVPVEF